MDAVTLPPLLARSKGLNHLVFHSQGDRMAVADTALNVEVREGTRTLWSRSMASLEPKVAATQRIRGLAYSPDGATLYALASDRLLALGGATGEPLWDYQPPRSLAFLVTSAMAVAVREDGLVAASFDNGAIGTWSTDGELQGLWKDVDVQRRLAFLGDGRLLGDDSFGLSVFDADSRCRLYRTPLRDRSFGLDVAPDGNVAIRTLNEAWQISPAGSVFARTPVEPGLPNLVYHPFETLLALGAEHSVTWVDQDGNVVRRIETQATVISLAFAPDGRLFVGGGDGGLQPLPAEEVGVG